MSYSAQVLKSGLSPAIYYAANLSGSLGKPTGNGWHMWDGLCPFHADRRPGSLVINTASGAFRCFACGARGSDIIAFHMQRHGLRFPEALNQLAGASHA